MINLINLINPTMCNNHLDKGTSETDGVEEPEGLISVSRRTKATVEDSRSHNSRAPLLHFHLDKR
jgi:hypothetical protein